MKMKAIAYLVKVKTIINKPGNGSEDSFATANIINKHLTQIFYTPHRT